MAQITFTFIIESNTMHFKVGFAVVEIDNRSSANVVAPQNTLTLSANSFFMFSQTNQTKIVVVLLNRPRKK